MATANFEEIFARLKEGVAALAKETVTEYAKQATAEGQKALTSMKSDLQRWYAEVTRGELEKEDLEFLIAGRKELTEMKALLQLGIARIQLDKFKSGLIALAVSSICRIV